MKILVTGGAGFIGSHLCARLLTDGHSVVCVDNLITGSEDNIEALHDSDAFESIRADISEDRIVLPDLDRIYNLACPASPIHYQNNPISTLKANTLGVINILELAERTGARTLQASTSEIYGDPLEHPQREDYWGNVNSFGPRSCYDEGKRVAEALFYEYAKEHDVSIRIARIFNTYGPNMAIEDGRVVSNFIIQALRKEDLTVYGDGFQTRSFCYVDDLVEGLIRLMESDVATPVNLGNPEESTIKELAETILRLVDEPGELVQEPLPVDDPTRRKPDITKATTELDWNPQTSLEDGLRTTIAYFEKALEE